MLRRVALARTEVSEEPIVSIFGVTKIDELGTKLLQLLSKALVYLLIFITLMMEAIFSSKTSVVTRTTLHNITEDDILHSHRRDNLKSYIALTGWTL
jgi:hypothetical protein